MFMKLDRRGISLIELIKRFYGVPQCSEPDPIAHRVIVAC